MEFTDALAVFIIMLVFFWGAVVLIKEVYDEPDERQRIDRENQAEINRQKEQYERERINKKTKEYEERDERQRREIERRSEINRQKERGERERIDRENQTEINMKKERDEKEYLAEIIRQKKQYEKEKTNKETRAYEERDERQRKEREYRSEINRQKEQYEAWKIANPNLGYLYILNNKIVYGYIKIGFTTREAIQDRIKEINRGAGVIGKWKLAEKWYVDDARHCEKIVHKRFKEKRTQKDREFFEIDLKEARLLIHEMMDKRGYYIDKGGSYEYWKDGVIKYNDIQRG